MYYLIIENLKIYKFNYLLSIITVTIGIIIIHLANFEGFMIGLMILLFMLFPEFQRLNSIASDGYLKLVNKLPLTFKEMYLHKFIVSISGSFFIVFMLSIACNFFYLPHKLFDFMNILISNVYAGIIINNSTKIFINPKNQFKFKWTFTNFFFYVFTIFIFFSSFSFITEQNYSGQPNWHRSANYLIFFSVQAILAFYIGKLREYVSKFRLLKDYDYENEPQV